MKAIFGLGLLKDAFFQGVVDKSTFKERYAQPRTDRLKQLFDNQLEKNKKLHPGFDKNCGLKGSKLSGG